MIKNVQWKEICAWYWKEEWKNRDKKRKDGMWILKEKEKIIEVGREKMGKSERLLTKEGERKTEINREIRKEKDGKKWKTV